MIEYTKEDFKRFEPNDKYLSPLLEAERNGDEKLAREIRPKVIVPAHALLAARDNMGPEWIIEMGFNCSEVERLHGKDWLYDESL